MKNPLIILFCFFLVFGTFSISAQEMEFFIPEPTRPPLAPENPEPPPRQFRELYLGMSLADLQAALMRDSYFRFRGPRDVSFLPVVQETLVETTGFSFMRRAHFRIHDGQVYIMSFTLNTQLMDHYSVFTSFVRKYGEPVSLSPSEAVWESNDTRVSIERPLTVKYIDKLVFDRLIEESRKLESHGLKLREEFLADF